MEKMTEWKPLQEHKPLEVGDRFLSIEQKEVVVDSKTTARYAQWPPEVKSAEFSWFNGAYKRVSVKTPEEIPAEEAILGGVKFDEGKLRYSLIPPIFITAVASVLRFGANKYSDRNWEKGMNWSRPYDALQRHMLAWWDGEKTDPETGYSHLWHAACCLCFLIFYEHKKIGKDDRP